MSARRVIVFAKAPEPGRVKTRLAPLLGDDGAAALHRRLVEQTLGTVLRVPGTTVELHCAPDSRHEFFAACAQRFAVVLLDQCTGHLGARMCQALCAATAERDAAVLIGSDCPDLEAAHLDAAFAALDRGCDAVIGPARDGGYYLLGIRRCEQRVFDDVAWGTEAVLAATRARLRELGWQWHELEELRDLDRPEDYRFFERIGRISHIPCKAAIPFD